MRRVLRSQGIPVDQVTPTVIATGDAEIFVRAGGSEPPLPCCTAFRKPS